MAPKPPIGSTPPSKVELPGRILAARVLDLLRVASLGLSAPDLLDLFRERGWVKDTSRGPYQRLLRILSHLLAEGLVSRSGRRYLLRHEAFDARLRHQAKEAIRRALATPFLIQDHELLQNALQSALLETLRERDAARDSAIDPVPPPTPSQSEYP